MVVANTNIRLAICVQNNQKGRTHNLTERLESRGRAQNGNRATLRVLDCFLCKSSRRRAIILPCDTRQSALLIVLM